jgi:hypothetical protein
LTLQLEKSDLSVLEFLQLLFLRTKNWKEFQSEFKSIWC